MHRDPDEQQTAAAGSVSLEPDEPAPSADAEHRPATGRPRAVGVIDVGSTSIRMVVAQIDQDGSTRPLEKLSRPVMLGQDVFTKGSISRTTTEACAKILENYRRVLDEYGIEGDDQIRIVTTTAVREADNRLTFLDRIHIATGFKIEPIDNAEVARLTFLGVQPILQARPAFAEATTFVVEVGGGGTELLQLDRGMVASAHSYRLGSLRLPELLKTFHATKSRRRQVLEGHVLRTADRIRRDVSVDGAVEMIALGGDARFAARQLVPGFEPTGLGVFRVADLAALTDRLLTLSADDLVRAHTITYPEAETLGPALLAYVALARAFDLERLHVATVTMRDGLLTELATEGVWTDAFSAQVVRSALDVGRRFGFDEAHGRQTAELSRVLFRQLREYHRLEPRFELLLYVAALLHDVGNIVSTRSHHKHAMYLIQNSELFGLSQKDILLVSLVARYHRRAAPRPLHEGYAQLAPESRISVAKMAAILRVADALDRSNSQRITDLHAQVEGGRLIVSVPAVDDLSLEQLALKQKGSFFEDVFGMSVLLRTG